jgi:3-oxoacyl-[acyl-carrier protein] reductase
MDAYTRFANSPVGRPLVRRLGLPRPVPLRRFSPDEPDLDGPFLVGGGGRLAETATKALPVGDGERYRGLVFDATAVGDAAGLAALYQFFGPTVRSLRDCGRVVILGTPPALCTGVREAAAQQALEGFVRSVGKELGRGCTANLIQVAPGADGAFGSTLTFLLSARSAFVSGQVVTVRPVEPALAPDAPPLADAAPPLAGKVAAVTGGARGIGAALARVLARAGATVVLIDLPSAGSELSAVANDVRGAALQLDLVAPDAPDRLVRHFTERHGRLDILVHNAGITRDRTLGRMNAAEWDDVVRVNLASILAVNDAVLDRSTLMGDGGRIIALSSVMGVAGNRGQTNYAAAKAGVVGMVRALAPVVADRGITVNAVAPGFIETRLTARMPWLTRAFGRRLSSLAQGGQPVDVAETIAWLAEPGSAGVTGNVVRVCGQSFLGA